MRIICNFVSFFLTLLLITSCHNVINSNAKNDLTNQNMLNVAKIARIPLADHVTEYNFEIYNTSSHNLMLSGFQGLKINDEILKSLHNRFVKDSSPATFDYMLCANLPAKSSCIVRMHIQNQDVTNAIGEFDFTFTFSDILNHKDFDIHEKIRYRQQQLAENRVPVIYYLEPYDTAFKLADHQVSSVTIPMVFKEGFTDIKVQNNLKEFLHYSLAGCSTNNINVNTTCLLKIVVEGGHDFSGTIILTGVNKISKEKQDIAAIPISNQVNQQKSQKTLKVQSEIVTVTKEIFSPSKQELSGDGSIKNPYNYYTIGGNDFGITFNYTNNTDHDLTDFSVSNFFMIGYTVDMNLTTCPTHAEVGVLKAWQSCKLSLLAMNPDTPDLVTLDAEIVSAAPEISFIDQGKFIQLQDNSFIYTQVSPLFKPSIEVAIPKYDSQNYRWRISTNMHLADTNKSSKNIKFSIESPLGKAIIFNSSEGADKNYCQIASGSDSSCNVSLETYYIPSISLVVKAVSDVPGSLPVIISHNVKL